MKSLGTKILETERLLLRKFEISDAKELYENWTSDYNINTYLGWSSHKSIEETEDKIRRWVNDYKNENVYKWVIIEKNTGIPIGSIGAESVSRKHQNCDLGYSIGSKWWNKGYMSEALKRVIDFLLNEEEMILIETKYNSRNAASGRVMEKVGMKKDATLRSRRIDENTGELSDLIIYSIMKEDFFKINNI